MNYFTILLLEYTLCERGIVQYYIFQYVYIYYCPLYIKLWTSIIHTEKNYYIQYTPILSVSEALSNIFQYVLILHKHNCLNIQYCPLYIRGELLSYIRKKINISSTYLYSRWERHWAIFFSMYSILPIIYQEVNAYHVYDKKSLH